MQVLHHIKHLLWLVVSVEIVLQLTVGQAFFDEGELEEYLSQ